MTTLEFLLLLVPSIVGQAKVPIGSPAYTALVSRGESAATDLAEAFARTGATEDEAKIAFTFSWGEANWLENPMEHVKGANDNGAVCGVMQTWNPGYWISGITCNDVKKSRALGYQVGLVIIKFLRKQCGGSLYKAMVAYSTDGACHSYRMALVDYRFKLAGLEAK